MPRIGGRANRVEPQDIASRAQLAVLAQHTADPVQREAFLALVGDDGADARAWQAGLVAMNRYLEDIWSSTS